MIRVVNTILDTASRTYLNSFSQNVFIIMCVFFWSVSLVRVVFTKFEAQLAVHYTDSHHQNGTGNWYKTCQANPSDPCPSGQKKPLWFPTQKAQLAEANFLRAIA